MYLIALQVLNVSLLAQDQKFRLVLLVFVFVLYHNVLDYLIGTIKYINTPLVLKRGRKEVPEKKSFFFDVWCDTPPPAHHPVSQGLLFRYFFSTLLKYWMFI